MRTAPAVIAALCCLTAYAEDLKPSGRPQMGMTVKPVVCRVLTQAQGKSGRELAEVIEQDGAQMSASNYQLATVVAVDPPIACYQSRADASKLPRGAR